MTNRLLNDKEKSIFVWGACPAGSVHAGGAETGSREYFEKVRNRRSGYEIVWLQELIPFCSFTNRTILELGCGAGYDAYEFCHHGAYYTGVDITPASLTLTKRHLMYYGYNPTLVRSDVEQLPFRNGSFDVVYSNGVLHHTTDTSKSIAEAFRVLRMGGELWVAVYHKNSLFYWITLFLVDHVLRLGFRRRSFEERLSMIEYTTSNELPLVKAFSRRHLRKMLSGTGFTVKSLWVRKLVVEDLPNIPLLGKIGRCIPTQWLDLLGKVLGWYIIARAEKQ